MRQVPRHRVVESACSRVGRAAQTAATFLSVLCLFFIIVFIAFVPASFEERIGYLFLFGLIPALGCYLIGHILRGALALSCKLCSMIAPHCLRWQARFTNSVLNWANGSARDLLERCSLTIAHCRLATDKWGQILCRLDQKQRRSVNRQYRYVRGAIINFLYLLIRNAARFIITLQQSVEQSTTRASCLSFDDMARNTMRCKRLVGEAAAARAARSTAQRAAMGEASSGPFSRVDADLPPPRGFVTGAVCGAEAPAKQRGELVADTFRRGHGVGRSQNW